MSHNEGVELGYGKVLAMTNVISLPIDLLLASGGREPPGSEIVPRLGLRATIRGLTPPARQDKSDEPKMNAYHRR